MRFLQEKGAAKEEEGSGRETQTDVITPSCSRCTRLNTKFGPNNVCRVEPDLPTAPFLPKLLQHPHLCLLSTLKYVEYCYRLSFISSSLYDRWMSCNAGNYQLGNSPAAMLLWSEFSKYVFADRPRDASITNAPLSAAISLYKCKTHGVPVVCIQWRLIKSRKDVQCLNDIWAWSSDADKNKTTLDAASVVFYARLHKLGSLVDHILPFISVFYKNVTATALLLHAVGNPHFKHVVALWAKRNACCLVEADFPKYMKCLSTALRRTGHWPNGQKATLGEKSCCAYWELAIGRSRNISPWADEERRRTKELAYLKLPGDIGSPSAHTNVQFLGLMKPVLDQIMAELVPSSPRAETWSDFCRRRQSWVSGGSSGGAKLDVAGTKVRINKHTYFEGISHSEMLTWIESEPIIRAVASEKFEMGKARAIYGTHPVDYSIMSFCISEIERKFYRIVGVEGGLAGLDEVAGVIRRCRIAQGEGVECTMIDYADFNYQHTLAVQALVFEALAQRFALVGANPDYVKAADWCAKALLNQWCTFPQSKGPVRVVQGMFSGLRGTNFLNTLLNVAYYRTVREFVARQYRLSPISEYSIHQGDDVWISNESRLWAIVFFNSAEASGFEYQPSKQMFGTNVGEFLRVLYTSEGARGYLARAIATFIVKPIQGSDIYGPAERAAAINSQVQILYRRGYTLEGSNLIWEATVPHAASVSLPSGGFSIPKGILKKSFLYGGLDLGPPLTMSESALSTASIPQMRVGSKELERTVDTKMTDDWIQVMSESVGSVFDAPAVAEVVHASNVADSLRLEDRMASLRVLERELKVWKDRLICTRGTRSRAAFDAFFNSYHYCVPVANDLDMLAGVLCRKSGFNTRTDVDAMFAAISSSPFRDISTAMRALKVGVIDAAIVCIDMCTSSSLRTQALFLLVQVRQRCSDEILTRILNGIRLGGSSFECLYHPIILSWLQKQALQLAITKAMADGVSNTLEWDSLLVHWNKVVLNVAKLYPVLSDASHY